MATKVFLNMDKIVCCLFGIMFFAQFVNASNAPYEGHEDKAPNAYSGDTVFCKGAGTPAHPSIPAGSFYEENGKSHATFNTASAQDDDFELTWNYDHMWVDDDGNTQPNPPDEAEVKANFTVVEVTSV